MSDTSPHADQNKPTDIREPNSTDTGDLTAYPRNAAEFVARWNLRTPEERDTWIGIYVEAMSSFAEIRTLTLQNRRLQNTIDELRISLATPPPGWFTFGTHAGQDLPMEFWGNDQGGTPIWERPYPAGFSTNPPTCHAPYDHSRHPLAEGKWCTGQGDAKVRAAIEQAAEELDQQRRQL